MGQGTGTGAAGSLFRPGRTAAPVRFRLWADGTGQDAAVCPWACRTGAGRRKSPAAPGCSVAPAPAVSLAPGAAGGPDQRRPGNSGSGPEKEESLGSGTVPGTGLAGTDPAGPVPAAGGGTGPVAPGSLCQTRVYSPVRPVAPGSGSVGIPESVPARSVPEGTDPGGILGDPPADPLSPRFFCPGDGTLSGPEGRNPGGSRAPGPAGYRGGHRPAAGLGNPAGGRGSGGLGMVAGKRGGGISPDPGRRRPPGGLVCPGPSPGLSEPAGIRSGRTFPGPAGRGGGNPVGTSVSRGPGTVPGRAVRSVSGRRYGTGTGFLAGILPAAMGMPCSGPGTGTPLPMGSLL